MNMEVLKPDLIVNILTGIESILNEEQASCCGLILARCTLVAEDLRHMRTLLGSEDNSLEPQFLYERDSGILAILLKDKKLSETHLLSLFLKQFMEEADILGSRVMVLSLPECGEPNELELSSILHNLTPERSKKHEIMIYYDALGGEKPSTIVIIDDDLNAGEFLNLRLQMKGYEVHNAYDGREGIRLCEMFDPDLVITELSLPVCDGFEVIRTIQQSEELDSKIMVLSGHRLEQDISACFDLGVSDYVKKPFSPVELEARIRRLLI